MCNTTGKTVFITRIKSADELAITLRKVFLKNAVELDSFKPKERMLLEAAFEQGAKVVFNKMRKWFTSQVN